MLVSVTLGLAAATLGFDLLLAHTTSNNIDTLLRQRVQSERSLLTVKDGAIAISGRDGVDSSADSRIWIFDGRKPIERPVAEAATVAAVSRLVGGPARFINVHETDEQLYAAPLLDEAGVRVGTIVAGVSNAPYEETRRAAVVGSLAFAALLLAIVAVAAWWLLKAALRPVAAMTEQAAAWSENDLERRFEVPDEPYDELTRLGSTLNGLLDRLGASLRHERRFSAELSHELRTPLSKVIVEAEIALRRERSSSDYRDALDATLRNAQHMTRIVETLVAVAQQEAAPTRGTADALEILEQTATASSGIAEARQISLLTHHPSTPIRLGVDGDIAERVLQPVVDNACRYARTEVQVALETRGNRVRYVVSDDGAGLHPSEVEAIFEPGIRGTASQGTQGAGLGLALARRLAHAASGEVTYEGNGRGATFVVSLPAA
ncbi:MAG TPA: ATP-binding protein [Gaiellaceae bacterium]|nr:ATP-binding protein [Gaiellaceae bacterium]